MTKKGQIYVCPVCEFEDNSDDLDVPDIDDTEDLPDFDDEGYF